MAEEAPLLRLMRTNLINILFIKENHLKKLNILVFLQHFYDTYFLMLVLTYGKESVATKKAISLTCGIYPTIITEGEKSEF